MRSNVHASFRTGNLVFGPSRRQPLASTLSREQCSCAAFAMSYTSRLSFAARFWITWAIWVAPSLAAGIIVPESMTPLLLAVHDAPVPFTGSDGFVHLVYELWITNFSSADILMEKVEVLGDG